MTTATLGGFLQHLRKAMAAETLASLSDRELVERFLASREEASFQALLQRHGPMVLRVCRRALSGEQDVEDVFQATFLVLARDARAIRKHESLANWLHGVAHRLAANAQKARTRRHKHETQAAIAAGAVTLTDELSWKELRAVLDEELVRLPEGLRAPLVLCYLEGLTQDEAAARLGQSKSTFRRNLERGRELLGARLARRGVTLSAALFALLLSECAASAAVPSALAVSTTGAAVALAAAKAVAALASAHAIALARGLAQPALSAKVKVVCVLVFAAVLAGFGGAAVQRDNDPIDPTPPPAERQEIAKDTTIDPPAAKVDGPKLAKQIEFRFPWIVVEAKVQTELKLTIEQVRAIDAIVGETYARDRKEIAPFGPIGPGQRPEGGSSAFPVNALRAKLSEILTDVQARRLRQLEIQAVGTSAFHDPANVKLLALTDEQRDKVRAITEALGLQDGRTPLERKNADIAAVRRILEILTDVQRKAWRDIAGEEFDFGWSPAPETIPSPGPLPALPGSVPPK